MTEVGWIFSFLFCRRPLALLTNLVCVHCVGRHDSDANESVSICMQKAMWSQSISSAQREASICFSSDMGSVVIIVSLKDSTGPIQTKVKCF